MGGGTRLAFALAFATLIIATPYMVPELVSDTPPAAAQEQAATATLPASPTPTPTSTLIPSLSSTPSVGATGSPTASALTPTPSGPLLTSASPRVGLTVSITALLVNGANFTPGAVVMLDGRRLETSFLSASQLAASVPAGLAAGSYDVTVLSQGITSAPIADGYAVVNLASVHHVPVVLKQVAGSSTGIQVQNLSSSATTVYVIYYQRDGTADPSWIESRPVPAGAAATFYQGEHPTLPVGFDGAAVIQSTQPVAAVVNRTRLPPPGPAPNPFFVLPPSQGSPPMPPPIDSAPGLMSTGSFAAIPAGAARQAVAPVVFGGFNGYRSSVSLQNTGETRADYTVGLFAAGSTVASTTLQVAIPPLASRRIALGPEVGVPNEFVGTAVISSTSGSVATIVETLHPASGLLFIYSGIPNGAPVQHAPLLFKNAGGWVSGAQVVNVTVTDVVVSATLRHRWSPVPLSLPARTLRPNESFTYYLPAFGEVPEGFVGAASFTASGPITLVVQHVHAERGQVMAYGGLSRGTPSVALPLLFKDAGGWNTGVQVQNLGDMETTVTIAYTVPNGPGVSDSAVVLPGQSVTFYQRDNRSLPVGFVGSAVVTSSNGQPIGAVVNEVNYLRPGDGTMAYEGVNY